MWDFLLDVIFPRQCLGCGKFGKYICDICAKSKIDSFSDQVCPYCEKSSPYGFTHPRCQQTNSLDGMFVLAHYRGLIPQAVHEIKYQGYFAITDELASLIASRYHYQFDFQYFIPVPLSQKRQADRGFNQAEKLTQKLSLYVTHRGRESQPTSSEHKNDQKVINLLVRIRETRPQFDLKMEERKGNVQDAFALSPNLLTRSLSNLSFCLVDAVATTGATIFECAKILKKSGAEKVYAICIARGG